MAMSRGLGAAALLAAVAFAVLSFALPGRADAHAVLERSLPVQNQQLAEPPELVETWYSEPLERSLTTLRVLDTQGNEVQAGETVFSDDPLYAAVPLPPDLGPGIYTLTFENVSQVDQHVWSGFFSFIILEPDGSVPEGEALIPGGLAGGVGFLPEHADSALRWIGLLAASLLAGSLFFAAVVARPAASFLSNDRAREAGSTANATAAATVVPAALLVGASSLAQLLLLADRLGGLSELGGIAFDTRGGELALSRIGLSLALAFVALPLLRSAAFRDSRQGTLVFGPALLGGAGLLMTYSLASHGAAGGGSFWAVGADFVHFAATAAWLGALLQLVLLFRWSDRRLDGADRALYRANALDRFSWVAVVSVVVLIGTGVFNGFVQLPTIESLWDTNYGRVLIAKLSLIVPMLAVAGLNAFYLKPRLVEAIDALHDEDAGERPRGAQRSRVEATLARLQRALPVTAAIEMAVGVAVIAAAAVLAQSTTADGELRLQATQLAGDFTTRESSSALDVELTISPFGIGVNEFSVRMEPNDGEPLGEVLGVDLVARLDDPNAPPSAGSSGTRQELAPTADPAVWSAEAALLTQPGDWRFQSRIRRRDADDTITNFSVPDAGGYLARADEPEGLFELPFTYVGWDIVAGGAMVALGLGVFLIWRNRPPAWTQEVATSLGIGSVAALISGAVLLFGIDTHGPDLDPANPIEATSDSIATGQVLFERNCVACHGADGRGDGPAAESLEFPPADLSQHVPFHGDGTIFLWITEGIPVDEAQKNMPAFKEILTDEERWHLLNYLRSQFSGTFEPVLPDDDDSVSAKESSP